LNGVVSNESQLYIQGTHPSAHSLPVGRDVEQDVSPTWNVLHVAPLGERGGDVLARLDPAELDQALAGLVERARDDGRRLGLALGPHDGRLALLLGPLHDELGALGLLLRNLLLLNREREVLAERHVRLPSGVGEEQVSQVSAVKVGGGVGLGLR